MATKTPKSWKSTRECKGLVWEMDTSVACLCLTIFQDDDKRWRWKISITTSCPRHDALIEDENPHIYEDEAANEGYRFAYRYLRPKRRKKRKVQ